MTLELARSNPKIYDMILKANPNSINPPHKTPEQLQKKELIELVENEDLN